MLIEGALEKMQNVSYHEVVEGGLSEIGRKAVTPDVDGQAS